MVTNWTVNVDYLTLTIRSDVPEHEYRSFCELGERALAGADDLGERKHAGVHGYYGEKVGPVFFGRRPDGAMVRTSGPLATEVIKYARPPKTSCTRVDVALTAWFDADDPLRAVRTRDDLTRQFDAGEVRPRRRMTLIDGCGNGDTLYVGSRTSDQVGRLYDKWKESNNNRYKWAWRYEVEFKGERALNFVRTLDAAEDRTHVLVYVLRKWWTSRGVDLATIVGDGPELAIKVPPAPFDPAKRLAWLATDVRPSIVALLDTFPLVAILWALGLPVETPKCTDG